MECTFYTIPLRSFFAFEGRKNICPPFRNRNYIISSSSYVTLAFAEPTVGFYCRSSSRVLSLFSLLLCDSRCSRERYRSQNDGSLLFDRRRGRRSKTVFFFTLAPIFLSPSVFIFSISSHSRWNPIRVRDRSATSACLSSRWRLYCNALHLLYSRLAR